MTAAMYVFQSLERSVFQANMPTSQAITEELSAISGPGMVQAAQRGAVNVVALSALTANDWGGWVGPEPRVTRDVPVLGQRFVTRFAWLWAFGDTPAAHANEALMLQALKMTINAQLYAGTRNQIFWDTWDDVIALPYTPVVNGPVADWASGRMAVTQTRDEIAEGYGRFGTPDNPNGPTSDQTHPAPFFPAGIGSTIAQIALWVAIAGGVVLIGPPIARAIGNAIDARSAREARKVNREPIIPPAPRTNPSKKKRRRAKAAA